MNTETSDTIRSKFRKLRDKPVEFSDDPNLSVEELDKLHKHHMKIRYLHKYFNLRDQFPDIPAVSPDIKYEELVHLYEYHHERYKRIKEERLLYEKVKDIIMLGCYLYDKFKEKEKMNDIIKMDKNKN